MPIFHELLIKFWGEIVTLEVFKKSDLSKDIKYFKMLINKYGKTNKQIAVEVKEFTNVIARDKFDNSYVTGEKVELYAYYGSYDHVAFCWLFGKMIDIPDMFTNDLKQMYNEVSEKRYPVNMKEFDKDRYDLLKKFPNYPKQENAHNTLDDAKWNRDLYNFIKSL